MYKEWAVIFNGKHLPNSVSKELKLLINFKKRCFPFQYS
jgi:hypothetical protein